MSSRNVETFRAAHQAFNRRDFDAQAALMADTVTYTDQARGTVFRGRDSFKEFLQGWVTSFSDAEVSQPRYIDGGDVVVAEFVGRGVNDGSLGASPPTGKQMNLPFSEIMRFDESGKIVSGAIYYDQLSMMRQLGLADVPRPASAAKP